MYPAGSREAAPKGMKQPYGFAGMILKRLMNGIIVAAAPAPPHSWGKNRPENESMMGTVIYPVK